MTLTTHDLDALRERLLRLCENSLAAAGYELVELEYVRDPQGWVLRVYIDHLSEGDEAPAPGVGSTITLEDCERASRHLSTELDVEDPINTGYRLEVSSPGLRRPLRKERDFARFAGRVARVQLGQPQAGRKNFTGRILSARDGVLELEVDGTAVQLPLAGVRKAHLEVEL